MGLHSLVLLDLRPDEGRFLTASEGLRILRERDPDGTVLGDASPVAVVARVGRDDPAAWFGPWSHLSGRDFGPPLHAIVVPADLHFEEAAALDRVRVDRAPASRWRRPAAAGGPPRTAGSGTAGAG
jgi:diphthine synthase